MTTRSRAMARALMFLVLATLISIPIYAQTVTGTLKGTVTDDTGAALPGVTVTIRNANTGLERVTVTATSGLYSAPFLQIGKYNVKAELEGFRTVTRTGVDVGLNNTTVQDFSLKVAAVAEAITVTADAPHVNVTDGEVKQTLRSEEIMTLPMPVPNATASFLRLASVFAGYQENPTSGQDNPTLSSGSSVNFNGAGTRGTTFQINGVNNDDSSENQHRQGVPLATIQSFQILTNAYTAEFGRGYGAVVLVQTKAGTNDISGEAYGAANDAQWNELSYYDKKSGVKKPDNFRRTYGITAGFPIVRDTVFFYGNYEYLQNLGKSLRTVGLFTAADLAQPRLTLGNDTAANRAWQDSILARWPTGLTPNNPAVNARAYTYPYARTWPDRDMSGRFDWNLTSNNAANARYQRSHQIRENEDLIDGEMTAQNNRESNLGMEWVNVLSSDTVQEARFGLGLRSTNVNILAGNNTPILRIYTAENYSMTTLGSAGSYPINRHQRDQQFTYNISSARFNGHTLKAGTDIRRSQLNDKADNYSRGYWQFRGGNRCGQTFLDGIAAFMAGCASAYTIAYGPFDLQNSIDEMNFYAQDDWRPFENLTLNLGVRYERAGAPEEKNNLINYNYKTTDYVDPRLGFAYAPDWSRVPVLGTITGGPGRFSIRGGYGIYHGRVFQSVFSQGGVNVRFNPPNAAEYWLSGTFAGMPGADPTNISDPTKGFKFVPGQIAIGSTVKIIDPNLQMPETRQWNLTFERQLLGQQRLRLSYVGSMGRNLLQYIPTNLPVSPFAAGSKYKMAQDWLCAGTGFTVDGTKYATTAQCPNVVPLADDEVSYRVQRVAKRRPDPNYGTNTFITNGAKTWYNAGQLEWETGYVHGFNAKLNYTFGKAFDTGSEATSMGTDSVVGDSNVLGEIEQYKRGLSHFDTRHRVSVVASYALPWFNDSQNQFAKLGLGGWTISTFGRYATGTPFTIWDSGAIDYDLDGFVMSRPVAVDPRYRGGWVIDSPHTSQGKMPSGAFRRAGPGDTIADLVPRNSYFSAPKYSLDLGLYKSFAIPGGNTLMVRLDAFNVFDYVNWGFPTVDWASTRFGQINSTYYSPRMVQVGFRFLY